MLECLKFDETLKEEKFKFEKNYSEHRRREEWNLVRTKICKT